MNLINGLDYGLEDVQPLSVGEASVEEILIEEVLSSLSPGSTMKFVELSEVEDETVQDVLKDFDGILVHIRFFSYKMEMYIEALIPIKAMPEREQVEEAAQEILAEVSRVNNTLRGMDGDGE